MSIVIGLDVGTSGTKAIAIDERGALLASAVIEYPLLTPKPGWAEQDPADWKAASLEALKRLAQAPEVNTSDVKGIGLTGQMHGSVFLDAQDRVLRNALLWCDNRTAPQCDAITAKVGEKQLIEMVCNPAPKILWLRDNEPHLYEKLKKVLLPKDYIRLVLTGDYATDVADASGTLLFNVRDRAWHTELMSMLDIDPSLMPRAYEGTEITGELSEEAANLTGLPAGIPVVAGGGDQAAGGIGNGIVRKGVISSTVGTSGVVFAFADTISLDPKGRVHTFCHSVPGKWHVMGVVLSAGGALRWFRDTLCPTEKAAAVERGYDPYDVIAAAAANVAPGAEGLTFLPYLSGERTPHKDPYARGAFVGLSLKHTRAHMARAVFEGVAFAMRDSLEIIREMGVAITQVRASGGGARNAFWRQVQADINKAPLVTTNIDEGPAYGAALLATVATGIYRTVEEACDAIIKVEDECKPNDAHSSVYDACFREYQETYKALAAGFARTSK